MKYTWKTVPEILRVIPPIFGGFRWALKDLEFDRDTIPKDWQIFWASASMHLDETIFAEPWKIDPSRFDGQTPVTPYSFVAFGGGPRTCLGNESARLEILVTVHHLVTRSNWKLCCKDDTYRRDPMLTPNQELPIQLKPRGSISQASVA